MPNNFELLLYAVVNYIPFILIALYPFADTFRFSFRKTSAFFSIYLAAVIIIFITGYHLGNPYHVLSNYLITLIGIGFYYLAIKARWGRMLFNLFMIKNIANFVVITAKCLEGSLFPASVGSRYLWTNSLCMLVITLAISPIILSIIKHYFSKKIRNAINYVNWRYLWLIPLFFYMVWLYIFYYSSPYSSLELALMPKNSMFMVLYLAGQMLVYICIARLVIYFDDLTFLEEANHRLAEQSLQYRKIQEHIREISVIKHDMRHHMLALSNYADSGNYEELKTYLQDYMQTMPADKISYCSNLSLNMLLVYYAQRCREEDITFRASLQLPDQLVLSDSDITVLFGNLLENAVEACTEVPHGNRHLSVTGKFFQNRLIFSIVNSYVNEYKVDAIGNVLSTKHSGYGIGTTSARSIVSGHNGTFTISAQNGEFSVSMIIPASDVQKKDA